MLKGLLFPIFIIFVVIVFIIAKNDSLPSLNVLLNQNEKGLSSTGYRARLITDDNNLKTGESRTIKVFLNGENLVNATVVQIDLNLDKQYMEILSSKPGKFFNNVMRIKMDNINHSWILAINPETKGKTGSVNTAMDVLEITVQAQNKTTSTPTEVGLGPKSGVYIANTKSYDLTTIPIKFSIN